MVWTSNVSHNCKATQASTKAQPTCCGRVFF
jgi:hypothetical protein